MQSDRTTNISSASELLRCQVSLPLFVKNQCTEVLSARFGPNLLAVSLPSPAFCTTKTAMLRRLASINILQIALRTEIIKRIRGKAAQGRLP